MFTFFEQSLPFCHSVICHSETTAAAKTINQGKSGATFPFDLLNANLIENAVGIRALGAFTNYVENILPIIDPLPTPC